MAGIKAHFDGKVIVPDEPLDLPRGQALVVRVRKAAAARCPRKSKGSPTLAWILDHVVDDRSIPRDFSHQLDHYLYGKPKRKL